MQPLMGEFLIARTALPLLLLPIVFVLAGVSPLHKLMAYLAWPEVAGRPNNMVTGELLPFWLHRP
jgi:hypothetical protein